MSTYERQNPETIIALQAARIDALEGQLRRADDLARVAEKEIRAILAGCGDTDEQMRASVPLTNLRGHLAESVKQIGAGNAAAGSVAQTAESVSAPPRATPTTPAETSALPTPEQIEAAYISRGHKPLRKLEIVRKPSTAAADEPKGGDAA